MTPFRVMYGRDPLPLLRAVADNTTPPDLLIQLQERDELLTQLHTTLTKVQQRMKFYADKKCSEATFAVGDYVLVKLHPYCQKSIRWQSHQKLGFHYFGPFPILERIGSVAYRLRLPQEARIHPVFHLSFLKHYYGDTTQSYFPLPPLTILEGPLLEPLSIDDVRLGPNNQLQVLVNWGAATSPTWESVAELKQTYPTFDLGDKVKAYEEGYAMQQYDNVAMGNMHGPDREDCVHGPGIQEVLEAPGTSTARGTAELRRSIRNRQEPRES